MADIQATKTVTETELGALAAYAQAQGLTTQQLLDRTFDAVVSSATAYYKEALKTLLPQAWAKATDQEKVQLIASLTTIVSRQDNER